MLCSVYFDNVVFSRAKSFISRFLRDIGAVCIRRNRFI